MKNMTFRRLKKVNSSDPGRLPSHHDSGDVYQSSASDTYGTVEKCKNASDVYNYKTLAYSGGTLPRNFKKGVPLKWKSLTQSPEQQRKIVILEKEDQETFGFEIQTYGLHHQNLNSVEMCTFVCKVYVDSPAYHAGLKVGDTISSVNDVSVEGFRHKEIVQLIRSSGNTIRLETVYGDSIRKAELETRLQYLKQTLHEKWDEYRSLMLQEQRLVHGIVMNDPAVYETLESVHTYIYGSSSAAPSPASHRQIYSTGSTCSSASYLSAATEGIEDPLYQTCLDVGDAGSSGQVGQNGAQSVRLGGGDFLPPAKTQLTRSASTRSYQRGAGGSWDRSGSGQGSCGSLPRKPKQKSFRRRLLKFIPGLNRSLEEEESKL
nr:PREDICTED: general receptor for phosphoinositides 1-associated scaffold protein [Lepisosteus oculatus]